MNCYHSYVAVRATANDHEVLLARLLQAREESDAIFRMVKPEAIYDRPIDARHRIIFYVGHLEAFDWNLLSGPCNLSTFNPEFNHLFAFGIDPVGGKLPSDQPRDWPRPEAVHEYRDRVRQSLDAALKSTEFPDRGDGSFEFLMNVAIEHRWMHAETLAYMFHRLPFERKVSRAVRRELPAGPFTAKCVHVPAGRAQLGLHRESGAFGWDNEFEAHAVDVPEFTIDRYKVTNGQFLKFIESGGYDNRALWRDSDWEWKTTQEISHPAFWMRSGDGWAYRSMFDEVPLPLDWPVYVSHAEANAYARWQGMALPTEAQWHRAACGTPASSFDPPGDRWDPAPVYAVNAGTSAFGVEGLFANGWEWTSTEFAPFRGFQPFACYPGYSANFFDGQHYVLKGGSVRTASCMLRPSFRNWFQPWYQHVYSGFRCVSA